jgi:hypothetical protein
MRSIIAIELCARFDAELHAALLEAVRVEGDRLDFGARWRRFKDAGDALIAASDHWHMGCWDFWDDNDKAHSDFQMWVQGMMTREGARTAPSGGADNYRGNEARYLTFTMACLLDFGSACERKVASVCDIPKDELWKRTTFQRVLRGMRHLSFAAVEKDTMYLIPRDVDWCLTDSDLAEPKFHYLRAIE